MQIPAGDPDIEIFQPGPCVRQPVPAAAWVLVTLLLIHFYKIRTENIFGEICDLFVVGSVKGNKQNKAYSRNVMIFCMTLVGYSTKAYNFLRDSANKCLPAVGTLRNYRKRVDGSPGFSTTAMNMLKRKVTEMRDASKNLFISVSCDDMSIRYSHFAHLRVTLCFQNIYTLQK